ncbi:MAG: hypothetical protein GY793_00685 [Proteobacteria bacterium]|nr:hypothetical protein [Pseudomonadota bacterium]
MKITIKASETTDLQKIIHYCDLYSKQYEELDDNHIRIIGEDLESIKTSIKFLRLGDIKSESPTFIQTKKMDLRELKLTSLNNVKVVNFPENINLGINSTNTNVEVIIYFIDKLEDIKTFVNLCSEISLPKDNTTILLYKKGRVDGVNLDSILHPFKEKVHTGFCLRPPILGTLSKNWGALIMRKEI